jgi:predicted ferric reductase
MVLEKEEFDQTSTWALALVALVFIIISKCLEKFFNKIEKVYQFSSVLKILLKFFVKN